MNPDLVARRRGPARKKDDGEDGRILCLLALDRRLRMSGLWVRLGKFPPAVDVAAFIPGASKPVIVVPQVRGELVAAS